MTREEAHRILSNGLVNAPSEHEWCMAFEMAIQALSQEPIDCANAEHDVDGCLGYSTDIGGYSYYETCLECPKASINNYDKEQEPYEDAISDIMGISKSRTHDIMENELRCVQTASCGGCDRECGECSLLMDDKEIIKAYGYVIRMLELPSVTQKSGKWDRLYSWLNDMRLSIAPDETVTDIDERHCRESQTDILDEIMEWMIKAEVEPQERSE